MLSTELCVSILQQWVTQFEENGKWQDIAEVFKHEEIYTVILRVNLLKGKTKSLSDGRNIVEGGHRADKLTQETGFLWQIVSGGQNLVKYDKNGLLTNNQSCKVEWM